LKYFRTSSEFTIKNPVSILIYPDLNGNAKGSMYYDDGKTLNYKNESMYTKIELKEWSSLTFISESKNILK
jgi:hypothetical protein